MFLSYQNKCAYMFQFATVLETSLCLRFFYVITGCEKWRVWMDRWMFLLLSSLSLSLSLGDESYSQEIMMMVVTGTEMPHIETRFPFPQSFFLIMQCDNRSESE